MKTQRKCNPCDIYICDPSKCNNGICKSVLYSLDELCDPLICDPSKCHNDCCKFVFD